MTNTSTYQYYFNHAREYCHKTFYVNISQTVAIIKSYLESIHTVLDLGCGSGRDANYFASAGKKVVAIDYCPEIVKQAQLLSQNQVEFKVMDFQDIHTLPRFDLIWANASLLHLTDQQLEQVLSLIYHQLSYRGLFFCSFKTGQGEDYDEYGRYFNYHQPQTIRLLLHENYFTVIDLQQTRDALQRNAKWFNILVQPIREI